MVPISRSTNGCESGAYGTVLISCTSRIRRFRCHWWNRYNGSWSELTYVGGGLLRDSGTPPHRIPPFHVDDGSHYVAAGTPRARLLPYRGREQQAIFPSL